MFNFGKKKCSRCGREVKKEWKFCPYCGNELIRRKIGPFRDIFREIDKEFERIDKMFSSEFFKFPRIKFEPGMRGGGISITITSTGDRRPEVKVKTYGDYKKLEPEIKKRFGIEKGVKEVEVEEKPVRIPKITEEPETKIEQKENKQIIKIKLPGVKSEDDIEVKRLEQSIEIKAFAGDKAYFKLIPVPPEASVRKEFKNGILTVEIER